LKDKEKLSADEKDRLKEISRDLADIYPDVVIGIDDETGALSLNTDALKNNIKQQNIQLMSKETTKQIEEYESQIENLKSANEGLQETIDFDESTLGARAKASSNIISKIAKHIGLLDKETSKLSLEDVLELENLDDFEKKFSKLSQGDKEIWDEQKKVLIELNNYHANQREKIEENKDLVEKFNKKLEEQQKILEKIQQLSTGEISFDEYNAFIEKMNQGDTEEEKDEEEVPDFEQDLAQFEHEVALGELDLSQQIEELEKFIAKKMNMGLRQNRSGN